MADPLQHRSPLDGLQHLPKWQRGFRHDVPGTMCTSPCLGARLHRQLFYPMELITQILRGMRDTADAEALPEDHDNIPQLQQTCPSVSLFHDVAPGLRAVIASEDKEACSKHRFTNVKMQNGDSHKIALHKHFRDAYNDEYTQEQLPRAWVEEAIHEELE